MEAEQAFERAGTLFGHSARPSQGRFMQKNVFFVCFFFGIVAQKDEAGIATRAWPL